jgi:DNA-binding XRE family transcriptional regulator
MDENKRKRLEKAGWNVGVTADFLELSPEEAEFVEFKLALARGLREERERKGLTQEELAREVGSSQSRVAKMEAADPSVSVDLIVRSLFKLGASRADVARVVRSRRRGSPV